MSFIEQFIIPKAEPDVLRNIDEESINSIYRISIIGVIVAFLAMIAFLPTLDSFDGSAMIRIGKFVFGGTTCLAGIIISRFIKQNPGVPHAAVAVFRFTYALVLLIWVIFVSYRQYARGDQLFTFFAIELLIICFIPLRPLTGMFLTAAVYSLLYLILYSIDGAQSVNTRNYIILIIMSIIGMIGRYQSQLRIAEKSVSLRRSNEMLDYSNRHDVLTNMRSRRALLEDIADLTGRHVGVYMLDVNYFKEINDTYGHAAGDAVLEETGRQLNEKFAGSLCYRYGGDEFLILSTNGERYPDDTITFNVSEVGETPVMLSIGYSEGMAENNEQFFRIISEADADLYEVKHRTHDHKSV